MIKKKQIRSKKLQKIPELHAKNQPLIKVNSEK